MKIGKTSVMMKSDQLLKRVGRLLGKGLTGKGYTKEFSGEMGMFVALFW